MKTNSTYLIVLLSSFLFRRIFSFSVFIFLVPAFRGFLIKLVETSLNSFCIGAINVKFLLKETPRRYFSFFPERYSCAWQNYFPDLALNPIKTKNLIRMRT
jgi:hypothetical protein